jgi:hypothetical protein
MNCIGHYNEYTQKFDYEDYVDSDINFTVYADYISATDINHSIYRFSGKSETSNGDGYKVLGIPCLDEKNRKCIFNIFTFNNGTKSISINYGNKMYLYIVDTTK